ncbi:MAG: hypothetical protein EBR10_11095, partial [Planctomycetes bacterium]|nr:hypothetical protein [Planctomycetota bacterium]
MDCTLARRAFAWLTAPTVMALVLLGQVAFVERASAQAAPTTRGGGLVFHKTQDDTRPPLYAKTRAVVIGINRYADLPALTGAVRDADT